LPSDRTVAISGSRPYANHTDRFYRESAALRCSPNQSSLIGFLLSVTLGIFYLQLQVVDFALKSLDIASQLSNPASRVARKHRDDDCDQD
jgi:hypothetical protein